MRDSLPPAAPDRRRAIESLRGPRHRVRADQAYAALVEDEADGQGNRARVATVFLTAAECSFRCAMCDLWRNTLTEPTPAGALLRQLNAALEELKRNGIADAGPQRAEGDNAGRTPRGTPVPRWLKLYNSGNFFDRRSVPPADYGAIAQRCQEFDRVIVENHPRLCDDRVRRFADLIPGRLEVAMGLETVQPGMLRRLNKEMTRDDFDRATDRMHRAGIDTRAFLLLRPPHCHDEEAVRWVVLSLRHAFARRVRHASIIPVRAGNGWIDRAARRGHFTPPSRGAVEAALEAGLTLQPRGVVTLDLWDWSGGRCAGCAGARRARLEQMNLLQHALPPLECPACDEQESNGGSSLL